jgi:hypothetical protein
MTQTPAIAPCPFCGTSNDEEEKIWLIPDDYPFWKMYAVCCDITGPYKATQEEALAAWNTRPPSPGELHWKANHDSVVAKSRVLIDRKDMPLERVKAYQYITEMEQRIIRLKESITTLTTES